MGQKPDFSLREKASKGWLKIAVWSDSTQLRQTISYPKEDGSGFGYVDKWKAYLTTEDLEVLTSLINEAKNYLAEREKKPEKSPTEILAATSSYCLLSEGLGKNG